MSKILPFVLSGGAGTRLWPLSRDALPKQFLKIVGSSTLFQQTCLRLQGNLFGELSVLSHQRQRFLVADQLKEIGINSGRIVLEPVSKNTAPSACIAALLAASVDPNALVLLAPSDHIIPDTDAFARAVENGQSAAGGGAIVMFGVEPDCPHTGYGYIETEKSNSPDLKVMRFVEKPSREAAETFLKSGIFFWNSGIFLFRAASLLSLFDEHAPSILTACSRALDEVQEDLGFLRLNGHYESAPAISLDHAVIEKAKGLRCVPFKAPWSDVGSWSAVWSVLEKDADANATFGEGEILLRDTSGSLGYSDRACVALLGVKDIIVVATEDAVLVASKEYAEAVRAIVDRLKSAKRSHAFEHKRVYRPWGWYETLNQGDRYQVKCIMVKPGECTSLQSHLHRSEHWVVVKGTLELTKGDEVELLSENQSTQIPIGMTHRLSNLGKIPAFLIEVQSGPYLAEDDIIRHDDPYGRSVEE